MVALHLAALHISTLTTFAADPPAKGDPYTDLRAATDQAVKKWSLGITSAFDDIMQTRWVDAAEAETRAKGMRQILERFTAQLPEQIGPPVPRAFQYLGSLRTGSSNVRFCYLMPHARNHYFIEIACLLIDGKWRILAIQLGAAVQPFADRFLQVERAAHLRFDAPPEAGSLKPASLSDLKHACDATLARLAAGATSGIFAPLMKQHWVTSGLTDEQINNYEAKILKRPLPDLEPVGKPLANKYELLGIAYTGTNYATLNYSLPYERGSDTWRFVLYRPAGEWRVREILHNEVNETEQKLFQTVHHATATIPESDRSTLVHMERMMAGVAKADPAPVVEFHTKHWINRDQTEKLAIFSNTITENLPSLPDTFGNNLTNSVVRLGYLGTDSLTKTHCFVNLRQRSAFPVDVICMLRDGQWQTTFINMGESSVPSMERFMRYERRTSSPPATAQSPVLAPSDLAALEQSCARFMSNAVTGKLEGALQTLLQSHKFAGAESGTYAIFKEAKAQTVLDHLVKALGSPSKDGVEYLGVGRLGGFLVKLTYQLNFLKGTCLWNFTFYRRDGQWYLDELDIPDEDSVQTTPLSILARPPSQIRPKATLQSPVKP